MVVIHNGTRYHDEDARMLGLVDIKRDEPAGDKAHHAPPGDKARRARAKPNTARPGRGSSDADTPVAG